MFIFVVIVNVHVVRTCWFSVTVQHEVMEMEISEPDWLDIINMYTQVSPHTQACGARVSSNLTFSTRFSPHLFSRAMMSGRCLCHIAILFSYVNVDLLNLTPFDSLWYRDAIGSTLVHVIMTYPCLGTKPLTESMVIYCPLHPWKQTSLISERKNETFH